MRKILHYIFLAFIIMLLVQCSDKPKKLFSRKPDYQKYPYWIEQMNDPNVNYFEAVKAFNAFWKDRGEPEMEYEGKDKQEEKESFFKGLFVNEQTRRDENQKYQLDYKRFQQWMQDSKPYVQADGSILPLEERIKIWQSVR